jgi:hypothetical protein
MVAITVLSRAPPDRNDKMGDARNPNRGIADPIATAGLVVQLLIEILRKNLQCDLLSSQLTLSVFSTSISISQQECI